MENNPNIYETLLESATNYGKTSLELTKLKAIDKTADVVSSLIPHSIAFALIAFFLLFISLGLAFWTGELLGKLYLGFFIVAAFYALSTIAFYLFLNKRMKQVLCDYIIKQMLK